MSFGQAGRPIDVAMTRPHPLTHAHNISIAQPVAWKLYSKFQSSWLFD